MDDMGIDSSQQCRQENFTQKINQASMFLFYSSLPLCHKNLRHIIQHTTEHKLFRFGSVSCPIDFVTWVLLKFEIN